MGGFDGAVSEAAPITFLTCLRLERVPEPHLTARERGNPATCPSFEEPGAVCDFQEAATFHDETRVTRGDLSLTLTQPVMLKSREVS